MRHLMLAAALLVLAVVGAAIWIGRGEVVTLRTTDAHGQEHATELWVAEVGGRLYLQGPRGRKWIQRLREHPRVEIERAGRTRSYDARVVEDPELTAAVDAAMAAKYGPADRLGHAVFDRQPALAVRLDPVESTPAAAPSPDTRPPQG